MHFRPSREDSDCQLVKHQDRYLLNPFQGFVVCDQAAGTRFQRDCYLAHVRQEKLVVRSERTRQASCAPGQVGLPGVVEMGHRHATAAGDIVAVGLKGFDQ